MLNAPLLREHGQCSNFHSESHASILSTSGKKDSVSSVSIQPRMPMSWTCPLVMNKNVGGAAARCQIIGLEF